MARENRDTKQFRLRDDAWVKLKQLSLTTGTDMVDLASVAVEMLASNYPYAVSGQEKATNGGVQIPLSESIAVKLSDDKDTCDFSFSLGENGKPVLEAASQECKEKAMQSLKESGLKVKLPNNNGYIKTKLVDNDLMKINVKGKEGQDE